MTKADFDTKYPPIVMPEPFAGSGEKTLPANTQDDDVQFDYPNGWGGSYSSPDSNNGKFVTRAQMNAIGNLATHNDFYHRCGGLNTFDTAFAEAIGGYPKGAVLQYLNGTNLYFIRSLVDNNMVNPETAGIDGINWKFCYQSQAAEEIDDTFIAHIDTAVAGSINTCSLLYGGKATRGGVITLRNLTTSMEDYRQYGSNFYPSFQGQTLLVAASAENDVLLPMGTSPYYGGWVAFASLSFYEPMLRVSNGVSYKPPYGMKECSKGDYIFVAMQNGYDTVIVGNNSYNAVEDLKVSFDIYII